MRLLNLFDGLKAALLTLGLSSKVVTTRNETKPNWDPAFVHFWELGVWASGGLQTCDLRARKTR